MLEVISRVRSGEISKATAVKVISAAFPLSPEEASSLLSELKEGAAEPEEAEGGGEG